MRKTARETVRKTARKTGDCCEEGFEKGFGAGCLERCEEGCELCFCVAGLLAAAGHPVEAGRVLPGAVTQHVEHTGVTGV